MLNWWRETVTTLHRELSHDANGRTHTAWRRIVLKGCFCGVKKAQAMQNNVVVMENHRFVRTKNTAEIFSPGDIILKGEHEVTVSPDTDAKSLLKQYDGFLVAEVRCCDLKGYPLPHIYLGE